MHLQWTLISTETEATADGADIVRAGPAETNRFKENQTNRWSTWSAPFCISLYHPQQHCT